MHSDTLPQPASCKSKDNSVVCSSCVDDLAGIFLSTAGSSVRIYKLGRIYSLSSHLSPSAQGVCDGVTADQLTRCLSPQISTLSQAGANLGALIGCNQAATGSRLRAKFNCPPK